MIDWNDPAARAALIERIGAPAYNAALAEHYGKCVQTYVNGHAIRAQQSRFGRLLAVGSTGNAYAELADAIRFANSIPTGADTPPGEL